MKPKIFKNLLKSINLKNKTAIITGAGGKLGKRISQVLGELNCNLILIDHPNVKIDYKNNKINIKTYKCRVGVSFNNTNISCITRPYSYRI